MRATDASSTRVSIVAPHITRIHISRKPLSPTNLIVEILLILSTQYIHCSCYWNGRRDKEGNGEGEGGIQGWREWTMDRLAGCNGRLHELGRDGRQDGSMKLGPWTETRGVDIAHEGGYRDHGKQGI